MIQSFSHAQPLIEFGAGSHRLIPELLSRLGRRVLLFTGSSWFNVSGWKEEFRRILSAFEVKQVICPPGEPTSEGMEDLLREARAFRPDCLLAVGGGSVLDRAKAASGMIPVGERLDDYLEGVGRGLKLSRPGVPWVAVPTTSGTGAEVTKNAVIKSRAKNAKKSLRSNFLIASYAVVDPEMTLDCPLRISGIAGLDALTQLIESYFSRKAKPITRALARDAFPVMLKALKVISSKPGNLEARTGAAYGSMISGIALANSGLGAAHGFASGLGGMYDIPHGLICALYIGPVLRANAGEIREDCGTLCKEAGGPGADEAVGWLVSEIEELIEAYDLPQDLKSYSIEPGRISEIALRSSGSSMSGNPRELSQEERENLLRTRL